MPRPRSRVSLTSTYERPLVERRTIAAVEPSVKLSRNEALAQGRATKREQRGEREREEKNPVKNIPLSFRGGVSSLEGVKSDEKDTESAALTSLLEQVSTLTERQQRSFYNKLAWSLKDSRVADNRDLDMWAGAVGTALAAVIGDGEGGSYGLMLLKRLLGSTSCWRPVEAFMTSSKLSELRVVERQGIYNLLAELLVDHAGYVARKSGAPLGPKLIGQCTSNLPGVFEASFPGYLAAGLAPMVAKQMSRPRS